MVPFAHSGSVLCYYFLQPLTDIGRRTRDREHYRDAARGFIRIYLEGQATPESTRTLAYDSANIAVSSRLLYAPPSKSPARPPTFKDTILLRQLHNSWTCTAARYDRNDSSILRLHCGCVWRARYQLSCQAAGASAAFRRVPEGALIARVVALSAKGSEYASLRHSIVYPGEIPRLVVYLMFLPRCYTGLPES